jgi:ribokinase
MIVVFGSINIDLVVPVPHLPRPGETVLGSEYALLPGGKGANQALAARRAGVSVTMVGAVGNDAFADLALANLVRDGVDLTFVAKVQQPTGCAAIMVGDDGGKAGENIIAVASGANRATVSASVPDSLLGPGVTVVCQMEIPPPETCALLRRARVAGGRTILNIAPALPIEPALFAAIDILIANPEEAAALGAAPATIARYLRQAFVVTEGELGATTFLPDGSTIKVPALSIAAVDTTGAGDTFVGVLAAGLDDGLGLAAALRRASAAAGLACLATGAQTSMPDAASITAAERKLS